MRKIPNMHLKFEIRKLVGNKRLYTLFRPQTVPSFTHMFPLSLSSYAYSNPTQMCPSMLLYKTVAFGILIIIPLSYVHSNFPHRTSL